MGKCVVLLMLVGTPNCGQVTPSSSVIALNRDENSQILLQMMLVERREGWGDGKLLGFARATANENQTAEDEFPIDGPITPDRPHLWGFSGNVLWMRVHVTPTITAPGVFRLKVVSKAGTIDPLRFQIHHDKGKDRSERDLIARDGETVVAAGFNLVDQEIKHVWIGDSYSPQIDTFYSYFFARRTSSRVVILLTANIIRTPEDLRRAQEEGDKRWERLYGQRK